MPLPGSPRALLIFLLQHLAFGLVAALLFGSFLLYKDVAHIRTLAAVSRDGYLALVLLFAGLCVTFGSFSMVVGIMGLGQWSDHDREDLSD